MSMWRKNVEDKRRIEKRGKEKRENIEEKDYMAEYGFISYAFLPC